MQNFSFAEDPDRPAGRARLFWSSQLDPAIVPVAALSTSPTDPDRFDLREQRTPLILLSRSGQPEELLAGPPGRTVRMTIVSGTLLDGPVRLAYRLSGFVGLDVKLNALIRFSSVLRDPMERRAMTSGKARRRALILRTLDALAVEPGYRPVAARLFGNDIVAREWTGRSDFLKSRVRRLVAEARRMAAGKYREELANEDR